ncbi:MAG: hypothetical protein ACK5UD_18895 [Planctomyces sp.]
MNRNCCPDLWTNCGRSRLSWNRGQEDADKPTPASCWELSAGTQLEASVGVNLETVRLIAETGVERISVGSLTHSSPALDLGFDWPWNRQIRH